MSRFRNSLVYLDNAATTPVDASIVRVMNRYHERYFYNPSALYAEAVAVRGHIEGQRDELARALGIGATGVTFTAGATEANNMVIQGLVWKARSEGNELPHIIMSATEHPSVRNTVRLLAKRNLAVYSELSVDEAGKVDVRELRDAITPATILVTVHTINNETGVIQPLKDIAKTIRWARKRHGHQYPLFHSDAAQAAAYYPLAMPQTGVDLLTLSSQKAYGPKGFGVIARRQGVSLEVQSGGGGQEAGYRPGTEQVASIIGGTMALVDAIERRELETAALTELRSWLVSGLRLVFPNLILHGRDKAGEDQSPHILSVTIPGLSAELLVIELAERGILAAARAACSADDTEPSHVLAAMYAHSQRYDDIITTGAVRISMGKHTKKRDLKKALKAFAHIKAKYDA